MGKVTFAGVTGKVAFDEFGDTKTKVLTVYKVKDGKWATVKTGNVLELKHVDAQPRRPPVAVRTAGAGTTCPAACLAADTSATSSSATGGRGGPVLQQLVNGLTLGSLYALIAVGYTSSTASSS